MRSYFDTSALVKLLVEEEGSDQAEQAWLRSYPVISVNLSRVETAAVLESGANVMVASDKKLCDAALSCGLAVSNPIASA